MQKKYTVRLDDKERAELQQVVSKLNGISQKVKRIQILLKSDAALQSETSAWAIDVNTTQRGVDWHLRPCSENLLIDIRC